MRRIIWQDSSVTQVRELPEDVFNRLKYVSNGRKVAYAKMEKIELLQDKVEKHYESLLLRNRIKEEEEMERIHYQLEEEERKSLFRMDRKLF